MKKKANALFVLAIVGVVILFILFGLIGRVFDGEQYAADQAASIYNEDGTVTTENLGYDPLVTVVPPQGIDEASLQAIGTDPVRGAVTPIVTIFEFGDFECENCAAMSPVIEEVLAAYPDTVAHVWKDFPLASSHRYAETAAIAARCAHRQDAFWEYHDELLANQDSFILAPWADLAGNVGINTTEFSSCLATEVTRKEVLEGYFIGKALEVDETPSYSINGQRLTGIVSFEEFATLIDEAL